jgi:hypothetical protein
VGVFVGVGVTLGVGVPAGRAAEAVVAEESVATSAETCGVAPLKVLAALTFQMVWLLGPNESWVVPVAPEADFSVIVTEAAVEERLAMVRFSWKPGPV